MSIEPLLSFLRFVVLQRPELAPTMKNLCREWCTRRPNGERLRVELLGALEEPLSEKVAAADARVDEMLDALWGDGEKQ